ncbi:unnamed protein product, partial [Dicrocoelium dendriticum]
MGDVALTRLNSSMNTNRPNRDQLPLERLCPKPLIWSTSVDSAHVLVCIDPTVRFIRRMRRRSERIDTCQLVKPDVLNAYQSTPTFKLRKRSVNSSGPLVAYQPVVINSRPLHLANQVVKLNIGSLRSLWNSCMSLTY